MLVHILRSFQNISLKILFYGWFPLCQVTSEFPENLDLGFLSYEAKSQLSLVNTSLGNQPLDYE